MGFVQKVKAVDTVGGKKAPWLTGSLQFIRAVVHHKGETTFHRGWHYVCSKSQRLGSM